MAFTVIISHGLTSGQVTGVNFIQPQNEVTCFIVAAARGMVLLFIPELDC
jgi:hypothetical protein